jgi:hypothetical protein
MGVLRNLTTGAVSAALIVATATPALADGFGHGGFGAGFGHGGYDGYGHREHHDGIDAGGIIAGIAIIGVIAAIASSASKSNRNNSDNNRYPSNSDRTRGNINNENAAVDACAQAAEQRGGQSASVRDITNVRSTNDGWDVEGVIEQRDNWRDRTADRHKFSCSVRYGAVDGVYIESGLAAR